MFSPTNFPARAFYVTAALNVRECSVTRARYTAGWFDTDAGMKNRDELFADRLGAINEAGKRLHAMQQKHKRASVLLQQKEARVAALQKGGAA